MFVRLLFEIRIKINLSNPEKESSETLENYSKVAKVVLVPVLTAHNFVSTTPFIRSLNLLKTLVYSDPVPHMHAELVGIEFFFN